MIQTKYIVLKIEDCKNALDPSELAAITKCISKVRDHRDESGKPANEYFVLGMNDVFARDALDKYIDSITSNPDSSFNNPIKKALSVARKIKEKTAFSPDPVYPDQEKLHD